MHADFSAPTRGWWCCTPRVVDKNGQLVTTLPQNAFKVYENGVEQQIKISGARTCRFRMGLIIDNSGSMREKRQKVEAAALALVKASNPQDEVFIVNFNDEAYLDVPFTNDIKKMEQGLTRIDSAAARPCATRSACPSTT